MSVDQPEAAVESLRHERLNVQKKTFTKWANVHLQKHGLQIDDLFLDLGDGLRLMKLLESLYGEKLGKPAKGSARINKIENVSRCLAFLHSKKMRLENISSEDIVDGKPHLILGLLWTIILRCEIGKEPSTIESHTTFDPPPQDEPRYPVHKIAKESLLLRCQTKTNGYRNVRVRDFHRSWRDGLAFNALIHSHLPKLVNFDALEPKEHRQNLENAFNVANKHIQVPRLLDPEDVDTDNPDEKSILVYVSTLLKGLDFKKKEVTSGKRIINILQKVIGMDQMKEDYENEARDLLEWIDLKIDEFKYMDPPKSLEDIQKEIHRFKQYRTQEKPIRNEHKNEIEALLFAIQMERLDSNGWTPSEETSPAEIEKTWRELERIEHEHEILVRNQLKEQERLENLAYKFESKRAVRESYLKEMLRILADPNYGTNIKQADATFKKHEAIRTGIVSREIMIQDLFKIADTLIDANYRRKDEIAEWKTEMEENWNYVIRLLEAYDEKFAHLRQVMSSLEEIDSVLEDMNQMKEELHSESEPLDVDASLQTQAVREVQVASWGEAIRRLNIKVGSQDSTKDAAVLKNQLSQLQSTHQNLIDAMASRREDLESLLKRNQLSENVAEMMAWIHEKKLYCDTPLNCKDLNGALVLQKKHKSLGSELKIRKELSEHIEDKQLQEEFTLLEELFKQKSDKISFAVTAYQYSADADECEQWILEKLHLLASMDYGSDEVTSDALLRHHDRLQKEISSYSYDIQKMHQETDRISTSSAENIASKRERALLTSSLSNVSKGISTYLPNTKEQINQRQAQIEDSFSELQTKCEERGKCLHHNNMFFRLRDGCKEMEKWMREKERILNMNEFGTEAEEIGKSFEAFITDLAAHVLVIEQLKTLCETLESEESDQTQTAKLLFDDVYRRWQHLQDLSNFKEKNLKGSSSLLLAYRICDETSAWLHGKSAIEIEEFEDIKSLDMLHRRQEAIERNLIPAEERVKQARILTENVANSYPDQRNSIQKRAKVLEDEWARYQAKVHERKKKMEESAGLQIFRATACSLMEWANLMERKLSVREKIGDMGVAEIVAKDHKDLGEEIAAQEEKFVEVELLGKSLKNQDVASSLSQLQEVNKAVHDSWEDKQIWLQQSFDLQVFNREADQLNSMCSSHDVFLDSADLGDTLSDMEILIRHHDTFTQTLKAQEYRFKLFSQMAESLIAAGHSESSYIKIRSEQVLEHQQNIKDKAELRKILLQESYEFQELKADAQEISSWIAEKNKLASELAKQDSTSNLQYKLKRQKTFEAEVIANENRLKRTLTKCQNLLDTKSNISPDAVENILSDLANAWNELWDKMQANQLNLEQAIDLQNFSRNVETVFNKMDAIFRAASSSNVGHNLRSVESLIKDVEVLEKDKNIVHAKVTKLVQQGEKLIEIQCSESTVKNLINEMQQKINALESPLWERRIKLETCLKFHVFKSDVDRELLWIAEQLSVLSTVPPCNNILNAQKFVKKMENLEVSIESHEIVVENLLEKVLLLVTEEECPVDVTKPCQEMREQWNLLKEEFYNKKEEAYLMLKVQSFFCEASEIDSWIAEKLEILSNTDYGKDEDSVIKLLTKHKTLELEIDSYKGLVEELFSQGKALIEANHPDSKIISNRMEVISQEMKNIEKLCSIKRQKLIQSKSRYEFQNESEELKIWISEQMAEATSEDFGEDYEHVLVLNQNFEFFRAKVEGGSKRIMQYEDFAKGLINSNCYFIEDVRKNLEFLSARWSELVEAMEARAFKIEAAAEIHRYHRDVTDILSRIHNHYSIIPQDLGNNRSHVQVLIKKHDQIENELLGVEAQVHLLLADSQRLQEAYPGGNEEHIQMQLALVIENWNLLQTKVSNRKAQLLSAERIHKYLSLVREEESWAKEICLDLESEAFPRDIQQLENDYKILGLDIETRLNRFDSLCEEGKSLLPFNIFQTQIEEKLKSLSDIQKRVKEAWERRSVFIQQKKDVFMFFQEAKQIQASCARREVQLCGSENKETVEDLGDALKKHLEFQKSMEVHDEKFMNWKEHGENLIKQRVADSSKVQKKIDELSERRSRLVNFSSDRSKSLSETLQHATFKRDTIEAEAWIQEKRNKLRLVLKGYNQLSDEEKIKCLQKQQAVQSELDAHEPFITNLIKQSKEFKAGQENEVNMRLQLILEDWEEVKENAARIGNDLLQARDMLIMHNLFDKTEAWMKEKELMIQVNEVGKDYEHCLALQSKLDDVHSDTKIDESVLQEMRNLAIKLSKKEDQKGVYIRYERISDRWNLLTEEMQLYRKKLRDAAQVHSFIKDADDTIDRIREKILILSAREEASELSVVQVQQRKLESLERDLTALDDKIKKQDAEAESLSQRHELSAGRIHDKMNQVLKEWSILHTELQAKKKYMDSIHTCLKYVKDVNDFAVLNHELIAEMEFGQIGSNSTECQDLLHAHNELQTQISAHQDEIKSLQETGKRILHLSVSTKNIETSIRSLQEMSNDLEVVWQNRLKTLMQYRDLQLFLEKTKQVQNWFSVKEAFLSNQDIGDSLSSVEALIRKHENFEETCYTNFEKIREVEMMARDLKDHSDYELIQSSCEEICRRRDALEEANKSRKTILKEAKAFQQLLLEMYEISNWMSEKIRVASDDSYRDLTNLLSKTQKHAAFEAEILANHSRVVNFTQQADNLLQGDHFAAFEIKQHVEKVESLWEKLISATNFRKERLSEAYEALQFKHKLDDINFWLEETESHIEMEETDSNVAAIQQQRNKHQELEREAEEYAQNLKLLNNIAMEFQQINHFLIDEITSQLTTTMQVFRNVEDKLQKKGSALQESLVLAGIESDIEGELTWVEENIKLCNSDPQYHDVMSVQALQKKLQALETEVVSRERLISSVVDRGSRTNNDVTIAKVQHLRERFQCLEDTISLRRLRLADALEAQKYYFEATQAEMWMKEKLSQVFSCECDRDIYSVQAVQKKLHAIEAAVDGFRQSVETLEDMSSKLIERQHFDSENIQARQIEVNDFYEELRQNVLKRTAILREKEDCFMFERDVKDLIIQLRAMSNVATATDHGRDVEHVESLLQKFELFRNRLQSHEASVQALEERGCELIEEGHSETESIEEVLKDLEETWNKCRESAKIRYEVLEKEKLVHAFYKSVDETVSWIYEKDVAVSSEDYGHDLESIKTLLKHHDTLEGDLKAIEEQVHALAEEAKNLITQFPDSKEDIEIKHSTITQLWEKCTQKALNRKDKLIQAEQLQSYFEEARDFHAWIYEMSALLTSSELPEDVAACEGLLAQHEEYKLEIDARFRLFSQFEFRGNEIISSGHFLSQDIQAKIVSLSTALSELLNTWELRQKIYEQNLDLQVFKKKVMQLETWLNSQEHNLAEENGRSVEEVDYLLQKHEQFEKKIELYESKFQELVESTKVEEDALKRREEEERKQQEKEKLLEQQKLMELKKKEEERILEERDKEKAQSFIEPQVESDYDYLPTDPQPSGFKPMTDIRVSMNKKHRSERVSTPDIKPPKKEKSTTYPVPPPIRVEGFLSRKQELKSGGNRSTSRHWKPLYTVLCGHLLCFFKDKKDFLMSNSAKPPVNVLGSQCYIPKDYHKKKYVFRIILSDNSAMLFEAPNESKRNEWMQSIEFSASLSPNNQFMTLEEKRSIAEETRHKLVTAEELYSDVYGESMPQLLEENSDRLTSIESSSSDFVEDSNENSNENYNIYDDPFEGPAKSFSITSYDTNPQSARSSLSNQSSYVTAAESTSSISTLQDEKMADVDSSDENYYYSYNAPHDNFDLPGTIPPKRFEKASTLSHGSFDVGNASRSDSFDMPDITPRNSVASIDSLDHDKLKKHKSINIPSSSADFSDYSDMFPKVPKKKHKGGWKVFSLRRKQ